jgi:hypothetical protein
MLLVYFALFLAAAAALLRSQGERYEREHALLPRRSRPQRLWDRRRD